MKQKNTTLVTRLYSDFDMVFARNANTNDIGRLEGPEAVKNSVRHLVETRRWERPFHPEIGSRVMDMLFNSINFMTAIEIKKSIEEVIKNHEPRVERDSLVVSVRFQPEQNAWAGTIFFRIKGLQNPVELQVILERLR